MSIIDQNSGDAINVWVGTQSEYDAITSKDEDTLYFIKESGNLVVDPPGPEPEPQPEPEPEPQPEPEPEPEPEPSSEDEEQYSTSGPRYDWYERSSDGLVAVTWNDQIKYSDVPSPVGATSVTGSTDGVTYTRGSLVSTSAAGSAYKVIKQLEQGANYLYPLNTATDPTNAYWRQSRAPGGYEFVPYVGIRSTYPIVDMERMFDGFISSAEGGSDFNEDIGSWDVSTVTNMKNAFYHTEFNQDISSWNVSNVTDMESMFAYSNFNQDISSWDVSNVTTMRLMFSSTPFNQDISSWNVSNVTNMGHIFAYGNFNQDISSWDVSNVTSMYSMFKSNTTFNQDISSWDVSNVTNMYHMFNGAYAFNQDISGWDVSNVTNMFQMFSGGSDTELMTFNQDLSGWNLSFGAKSSTFQYNESLWTLPKPGIKVWENYKITRDTIPSDWSLENGGDNANGLLYVGGLQNNLNKTEPNPPLTFKRGNLYSFQIDSGYTGLSNDTAEAHPLYLTTDDGSNYVSGSYFGEYTNGVTIDGNEFYRQYQNPPNPRVTYYNDKLQFEVPLDAPDTLYYQCGAHGSMRGTISIID